MRKTFLTRSLITFAVVVQLGCFAHDNQTISNNAANHSDDVLKKLREDIEKIQPFFKPMDNPERFDWLASFKEPGQTFDEYIESNPTVPSDERKVIYVLPLGKFTANQRKVVQIASEYIEAFYGLKTRSLPARSLPAKLSETDQRMIDYPQHRQVRTGYVLEKILQPALPKDAAALIALTDEDLYPDASMYFVFGQASLADRVGIWSLFRLDDDADSDTFLERTMKISVHEVGHMFSMRHCTKYECVMSGTNHLGETDRRPIDACPECMAKIAWMMKEKPIKRYERLVAFAKKNNLSKAASDFESKRKAVE